MSSTAKSTSEERRRLKYMSPGPAGRSKESLSPIRSTEFWDKLRSEPTLKNGRQRRHYDDKRKAGYGKNFNPSPMSERKKYVLKNQLSRSSKSRSRSSSNRRRNSSRDPSRASRWIEGKSSRQSPDRSPDRDMQDILFYQTIEKLTNYKSASNSSDSPPLSAFNSKFSVREMPRFESSFQSSDWTSHSCLEKENRASEFLMSIQQEHDRNRYPFDHSSRFESWKNLSEKYPKSRREDRLRSRSIKRSKSSSRRRKSYSSTRRRSPHNSKPRSRSKCRSRSKSRHRSRSSKRSRNVSQRRSPQPNGKCIDYDLENNSDKDQNAGHQRQYDYRQNNHHEDHYRKADCSQEKHCADHLPKDHYRQNDYSEDKSHQDHGQDHRSNDHHQGSIDFGFASDRSKGGRELTEKELVDLKFPLFDSGVENRNFEKSAASYTNNEGQKSKANVNNGNIGELMSERLCKYYLCGYCKMGSRCSFSHKCQPLVKKKVELCLFYAGDGCSKGELCQRLHKQFPCKDFHKTRSCYLGPKKCKFSHDSLNLELENALNRFISFNPTVKRKHASDQYQNAQSSFSVGAHVDLDMPKYDVSNANPPPFFNQRSVPMSQAGTDTRPIYGNHFSAPVFYNSPCGVNSRLQTGQNQDSQIPASFIPESVHQRETCGSWQSLDSRRSVSNESLWKTSQGVQGYQNSVSNEDNGNGIEWYVPSTSNFPSYDLEDVSSQSESEFDAKISPQSQSFPIENQIPYTLKLEEPCKSVFVSKESPTFNLEHTKTYHPSSELSSNNKYIAIPFERQCSLKDPRIENFNNDASIYRGLLTTKVFLPSLPGIRPSPPEISCNYIIPWRTLRPITLQPIESVSSPISSVEKCLSGEALPVGGVGMMPLDKPEILLEIQKEIQSFCESEFEQTRNNNDGEMTSDFNAQSKLSIKDLFCMADPTASPFA